MLGHHLRACVSVRVPHVSRDTKQARPSLNGARTHLQRFSACGPSQQLQASARLSHPSLQIECNCKADTQGGCVRAHIHLLHRVQSFVCGLPRVGLQTSNRIVPCVKPGTCVHKHALVTVIFVRDCACVCACSVLGLPPAPTPDVAPAVDAMVVYNATLALTHSHSRRRPLYQRPAFAQPLNSRSESVVLSN